MGKTPAHGSAQRHVQIGIEVCFGVLAGVPFANAAVGEGFDGGGPRFPESVIQGVTLSWLTTIAGFGSLMVAHHRGIFSLGLLLSIGSTASLAGALFVLPVLIGLFVKPPISGRAELGA